MASKAEDIRYLEARGIRASAPEVLNLALAIALKNMSATLFGDVATELTTPEQDALRCVGVSLSAREDADPIGDTAAEFAALIESSISTTEFSKRTGHKASRVRQMIADRSLFSMLLDGRRYIPVFQFMSPRAKKLVPHIGLVTKALDPEFHPLQVYGWFITPNPDLTLDDEGEHPISPLDWLKRGHDPQVVVRLAQAL